MIVHYLEDLTVGRKFVSRPWKITAAQIKAFAAAFDPQPFHMDEDAAAKHPLFRGLAASGWHTGAITMRLMVSSDINPAGGLIGARVEELRWTKPVRPDDELHAEIEVLENRVSESRPDQGWAKIRTTTRNQAGEPVQIVTINIIVDRRPADPPA